MKKSLIQKIMRIKKSGQRGYTLLFAVLVSALVLGVGVSILNIARKELLLNSSARESQYAFYAADAGYECALYWETQGAFATSSPASAIQCGTLANANGVSADGNLSTSSIVFSPNYPSANQYSYTFYVPIGGRACAQVNMIKTYGAISVGGVVVNALKTQLLSSGYNVGWNATTKDCSTINAIKVERALLVTY